MRIVVPALLVAVVCSAIAQAEEPTAKVEAAIRRFHTQISSPDEAVQVEAIKTFLPDEKTLQKLFGMEKGTKLWSKLGKLISSPEFAKRAHLEAVQAGKIQAVQLIDVRINDDSKRYQKVLPLLPKDIGVYRAIIKRDTREGGSSSYVLIGDDVRFVRGLEEMAEIKD